MHFQHYRAFLKFSDILSEVKLSLHLKNSIKDQVFKSVLRSWLKKLAWLIKTRLGFLKRVK